jgi:hypothetical protein
MKRSILAFIFTFSLIHSFSQTTKPHNTYIKLSGGKVVFGTGDYFGYFVALEASRNIVKKPAWGLSKLLLGGELIMENGVSNPVVVNPTLEEVGNKFFYHTSSTILWTKASYYPFKAVLKGFNIQVGPTVGYSNRSKEVVAVFIQDASGSVRQSYLGYDNGYTMGYRISTGIEFDISKKLLAGFRLDFSNNNKGEINTYIGLKTGIAF